MTLIYQIRRGPLSHHGVPKMSHPNHCSLAQSVAVPRVTTFWEQIRTYVDLHWRITIPKSPNLLVFHNTRPPDETDPNGEAGEIQDNLFPSIIHTILLLPIFRNGQIHSYHILPFWLVNSKPIFSQTKPTQRGLKKGVQRVS